MHINAAPTNRKNEVGNLMYSHFFVKTIDLKCGFGFFYHLFEFVICTSREINYSLSI